MKSINRRGRNVLRKGRKEYVLTLCSLRFIPTKRIPGSVEYIKDGLCVLCG